MRLDRLRAVSVTGCGGRRALGTSEIEVVIADESDVIRIARGGRGDGGPAPSLTSQTYGPTFGWITAAFHGVSGGRDPVCYQ